jgi:uncharacterized membrane protein
VPIANRCTPFGVIRGLILTKLHIILFYLNIIRLESDKHKLEKRLDRRRIKDTTMNTTAHTENLYT